MAIFFSPKESLFLTRAFFHWVVERIGMPFEQRLHEKDVSQFGDRDEWNAFCEKGHTKRMFFRFAIERNGVIFDMF